MIKLTFRDFLLLIIPFGWGVTCLLAAVTYGIFLRALPSILAFISCVMSFILVWEIWFFHRKFTYNNLQEARKNQRTVLIKFIFSIIFIIGSLVVSTYIVIYILTLDEDTESSDSSFNVGTEKEKYGADLIWCGFTFIFAIIWLIELKKYHLGHDSKSQEENQTPKEDNPNAAELDDVALESDDKVSSNSSSSSN